MNTTPHAAPLFLGLVTLLSCSEDRSGTKTERPEAEIDAGRQADRATADPTPDAAPPVVVQSTLSRAPGRMTVDQLRRSIEIITGGLVWEEDFGDGEDRREGVDGDGRGGAGNAAVARHHGGVAGAGCGVAVGCPAGF